MSPFPPRPLAVFLLVMLAASGCAPAIKLAFTFDTFPASVRVGETHPTIKMTASKPVEESAVTARHRIRRRGLHRGGAAHCQWPQRAHH